jgi:hypothetical protein
MIIDPLNDALINEVMANYVETNRPPVEIRDKCDLGYKIENQSVILFEIQPTYSEPIVYIEIQYAKATFVKKTNIWKVFWLRANLNWENYQPHPTVNHLTEFLKLVDEDKYYCFRG